MTFSQMLSVLQARWRSAALVFAVVVGTVLLATWVLPKKYTATASVVLDVKSPDPIAGVVLPGMTVSGYMATQVDVLQSERVVLRALRALGLDRDARLRAAWQEQTQGDGDFEAWLADDVIKHLDVKPGKDSNVMAVSYTAREPKLAATTINAVVKAYIETSLELRTEPAKLSRGLFDETTRSLRESLELAQARLSAFQQSKGIVATDERLDVETSRMAELSTQQVALQATATESAGRQREAGLKSDQMQEVLSNPMVTTLSTELARMLGRLNELGERYGNRHPQVLEMQANADELRKRLNLEKQRIAGSLTVNNTVNQTRLDSLRAAVDQQRSKVLTMKGLRDEASGLQRDVDNAQKVYDAGFVRLSQSMLESQATQTNISVLKTATPPAGPSSPRLGLNLGVAMLLGAALATATALLRERRDWRLRHDTDVIEVLQLPLLGVLPRWPQGGDPGDPPLLGAAAQRLLGRSSLSRS